MNVEPGFRCAGCGRVFTDRHSCPVLLGTSTPCGNPAVPAIDYWADEDEFKRQVAAAYGPPRAISETDKRASARPAGAPDPRPSRTPGRKPTGRTVVLENGGRVSVPIEPQKPASRPAGPRCPQRGCSGRLITLSDYTPREPRTLAQRFAWLTGHAFNRRHPGMTRPNGVDVGTVYRCSKCRCSCNVPPSAQ